MFPKSFIPEIFVLDTARLTYKNCVILGCLINCLLT